MFRVHSAGLAAAIPLAVLAATPLADETLALTVEEGTRLTKTFTSNLELELDEIEISLSVDGEEQPAMEAPEIELSITEYEEVVVEDEYLAVADGAATKVARTFRSLTDFSTQEMVDPEGESDDKEDEGTSPLEGHEVVFTWDADEEAWSAEYAEDDEGGDADALDGLEQWADLLAFLPDGAVEVGDEWEAPVEAFLHLSSPCGDMAFVKENDETENDDEFSDQFEENLDGEIVCKLESVEDGVARITVAIELTTDVEVDVDMPEEAGGMEATQSMAFEFELEGHLLWSIEAGHLASAEVEGDVNLEVSSVQSGAQEGREISFEQTQVFTGVLTLTAEVE